VTDGLLKILGEGWRDARLFGVVMEKIGQKWKVKWDFDREISVFETDILFKESDSTKQGKFLLSRILKRSAFSIAFSIDTRLLPHF